MAKEGPVVRATATGAVAGAAAAVTVALLLVVLARRLAPKLMPTMMRRMMAEGGCSEQMRACMERCGCLRSGEGTAGKPATD